MPHIEKDLVVSNKKGLHARPAALLVQLVERYGSKVTIIRGEEKVDGKSIMGLLMLGAQHQMPLKVVIEGEDAPQVMTAIEHFFSKQEEELML